MKVRDWYACIAVVRALGRAGRADAGEIWRLASKREREIIAAHLQSLANSTLGFMRIEHRRRQVPQVDLLDPEAEPTDDDLGALMRDFARTVKERKKHD